MAQYDFLPIYKKAFDLCIYFEKIVKNFSRYNKYTLGADLRNKSRAICVCIAKANSLVESGELDDFDKKQFLVTKASYFGHFKHADFFRIKKIIWMKLKLKKSN
jgi:hypothetical protein